MRKVRRKGSKDFAKRALLAGIPALAAPVLVVACVDFSNVSSGNRDAAAPDDDTGTPAQNDAGAPSNDGGSTPAADVVTAIEAAADVSITCSDGMIACGGACIDPKTDPGNCNGCGNVCSSGHCGSSLSAPMTALPAGWAFNGTGLFDSTTPSAVLTKQGVANQSATVLYANPVVLDGFDAKFSFRMGAGGGGRGDGMGFVMEQTGPSAVGGAGDGLGMSGLAGFGVELDTFDNNDCGDVSGDHVGIDELSACASADGQPTSLSAVDLTNQIDIADGEWHQAEITLVAGVVSLTIDGDPVLTNVTIGGITSGPSYYLGFSGATGNLLLEDGGLNGYRQEVRDVAIAFPTARCL